MSCGGVDAVPSEGSGILRGDIIRWQDRVYLIGKTIEPASHDDHHEWEVCRPVVREDGARTARGG
jgi:hypothetical protein